MSKLEIKKSIEVNTNAVKTWEIIGPNFLKISDWARGVNKSWENENVSVNFDKAPAGGRYCDVEGFGKFDERIIHYDNEKREISWSADAAKIPNFVSGLKNEIKVEEMNSDSCKVSTNISANLKGIGGFFLGGIMKKKFSKSVQGFLIDWKTYAETRKVSEKKRREIEKTNS